MFKIVNNERLSDNMFRVTFEAPLVARKAQPGQFLMFRVDEFGERMPITISSYDREAGTVSVIMQRVGSTTALLASKKAGDYVADVVGPLGNPAEFDDMHKVVVVGGGSGCAIAWPQAKEAHRLGCEVDIIAGFRTKGIVVLEEEMRACCDHLYMMTDDGTYGEKGFTTVKLKELHIPAYTSEFPQMNEGRAWQTNYTLLCFAAAFLLAAALTYFVEKPAGRALLRLRERKEKV